MNALRVQYFLAIAITGALMPYQSVYLRECGMSDAQVGWVQSMTGIGVLLMPVLMTLIADLRVANRRLLAVAMFGVAGAAAMTASVTTFTLLAASFAVSSTMMAPMRSLMDGVVFGEQARRAAAGLPRVPYHHIRVYGTVGFIVPCLMLYWLLRDGTMTARVAIVTAAALAAAAGINTFTLPDSARAPIDGLRKLPTIAALRAMMEPQLAVYMVCMWLFAASNAAFFGFFPIYLTERLGVGKQWVGLIVCVGVVVEVFCVLGFGRLLKKLGIKRLTMMGYAAGVIRFALLWATPNVALAVALQALHGVVALSTVIGVPVYLNHRSEPAYRNSIQGTYVMLVDGTGRIAGFAAAGYIAGGRVEDVFLAAALATIVSMVLFALAFRETGAVEA